ncbi:hypothetical protein CVT24_006089 [Panaeolus cyanescens]|uniref:Uncharacterized protein n=1 Tax=Panaeolus cyanescens TaxID=181874 RepID=A0A409V8S2_9AGAR|nr:hypothetical protein CVT24_006089 [Panaeolus cyanescens]
MPSPPISLFMTTIASQPVLRKKQEYVLRILQAKKIPFTTYDLASDEDAKRIWRRKAPAGKQQLPGILVGGKFPGTVDDFEDAVEHDELAIFLRLNEKWDPIIDEDRPMPVAKPVGIPGAYTPLEMTPEHLKAKVLAGTPSPSPLAKKTVPVNKRTDLVNVGEDLSEFGLSGVQATMDELKDLLSELGLEGDAAGDLAKGLSNEPIKPLKFAKKATDDAGTVGSSGSGTEETVAQKPAEPKSDEKSSESQLKTKEAEPEDGSNKEVPTTEEVTKLEEEIKVAKAPKVEVELESETPASTTEAEKEEPSKDELATAVKKIEDIPSDKVPAIEELVPEVKQEGK